jgi:membrane protein YqaA with SNARE-associated domain
VRNFEKTAIFHAKSAVNARQADYRQIPLPRCAILQEHIELGGFSTRASGDKLKALAAHLGRILILYGPWGLFAISFLDSSLVPFPVLNDLALMMMSSNRPAWWPLYALASTLGSIGGAYLLYGIARGGGTFFLRRTTTHAVANAHHWLERNELVSVLVAALLPPPAPYKLFILTAGVLRVNPVKFGLALLVGRGLRFGAEAWLGAHYGAQAQTYVRKNLGWASLGAVVLVVGLVALERWVTKLWAREKGRKARG